jgi:hypothetical protein
MQIFPRSGVIYHPNGYLPASHRAPFRGWPGCSLLVGSFLVGSGSKSPNGAGTRKDGGQNVFDLQTPTESDHLCVAMKSVDVLVNGSHFLLRI